MTAVVPHPFFIRPVRRAHMAATLTALALLANCAYYNTFYHARKYFGEAEEARLEAVAPQQRKSDAAPARSSPPRGVSPGSGRSAPVSGTAGSASAVELYDKAIEKASRVLTFHPKSRWVDDSLLLMGKAFYWKEEYAKAARKFEELTVHFPESEYVHEARYWQGLALWKMGREREARRFFETFTLKPTSSFADNALLSLAEMAFEKEDYERVVALCQSALATFKKSEVRDRTWLLLGKAQFALRQYPVAAETFSRAITRRSAASLEYEARFMRARSLKEQGKYAEAMALCARLSKRGQFGMYAAELGMETADCLVRLGDVEAALEHYGTVVEDYPKTSQAAQACYRMGYLYETVVGDLAKARSSYEKAKEHAESGEAVEKANARAQDLGLLDDYLAELAPFLRAGDGDSRTANTLLLLAELYLFRFEQPDSALKFYQVVVDAFPGDSLAPKAHYAIGWIQAEVVHDSSAARTAFEELVRRYPDTDYARSAGERFGATRVRSDQQRAQDAATREFLALEAVRLAQAEPSAYLPGFEKLTVDYPQSPYAPQAAYVVAWTYDYVLQDSSKAREAYKRLGERFPNTEYGALARKKLEALGQQHKEAPVLEAGDSSEAEQIR